MSYDYNAYVFQITHSRRQIFHILVYLNKVEENDENDDKELQQQQQTNAMQKTSITSTIVDVQTTTNHNATSKHNVVDTLIEPTTGVATAMHHDHHQHQRNHLDVQYRKPSDIIDKDNQQFTTLEKLFIESLSIFDTLAKHCPMTVMLWMKYGHTMYLYNQYCVVDSSTSSGISSSSSSSSSSISIKKIMNSIEMRLHILEMGLDEFPGSCMLQLHYLDILFTLYQLSIQQFQINPFADDIDANTDDHQIYDVEIINERFTNAVRIAIEHVGCGSHYNEGSCIEMIFELKRKHIRLQKQYYHQQLQKQKQQQQQQQGKYDSNQGGSMDKDPEQFRRALHDLDLQLLDSYIQQSHVPMKDSNDELGNKLQTEYRRTNICLKNGNMDHDDNDDSNSDSGTCKDGKNSKKYTEFALLQEIDRNKLWVSKVFNTRFIKYEDDIVITVQGEGQELFSSIWNTYGHTNSFDADIDESTTTDGSTIHATIGNVLGRMNWWDDQLLYRSDCIAVTPDISSSETVKRIGMGLGGVETASVFIKYARALRTYHLSKHSSLSSSMNKHTNNDEINEQLHQQGQDQEQSFYKDQSINRFGQSDEEFIHNLSWSVYERGIVECPTVESIWISYIRSLCEAILGPPRGTTEATSSSGDKENRSMTNKDNKDETNTDLQCSRNAALLSKRLESVTNRAVRNCPYSASLVHQQLQSVWYSAEFGFTVFDPDKLIQCIDKAIDRKFLSINVKFDLYITAIRVAKRRILSLLSKLQVHSNEETKVGSGTKATKKPTLSFDDFEEVPNTNPSTKGNKKKMEKSEDPSVVGNADEALLEEIYDLAEDMRDMYDEFDNRFKKQQHEEMQEQKRERSNSNNNQDTSVVPHVLTSHDRALLFKERAMTESLLLVPLLDTRKDIEMERKLLLQHEDNDISMQLLERSVRAHNPPHPDLYLQYIQHYISNLMNYSLVRLTDPSKVVGNLRKLRYLYDKALTAVGNPYIIRSLTKKKAKKDCTIAIVPTSTCVALGDYDLSLRRLSQEWIEFEHTFGSERSLHYATKRIQKKFEKVSTNVTNTEAVPAVFSNSIVKKDQIKNLQKKESWDAVPPTTSPKPTTLDESLVTEFVARQTVVEANNSFNNVASNMRRTANGEPDLSSTTSLTHDFLTTSETTVNQESDKTNHYEVAPTRKRKTTVLPTVRIGNLEYPAHPYTIRISCLPPETEDMDLVDVLRPKCGPIVHARIIREKHPTEKHQHKGWGLVQFEECESVQKALELNDIISIREKLIKIERSHMPAISLTPPGMHRVRPTGEGTTSKRKHKKTGHNRQEGQEASITGAMPEVLAKVKETVEENRASVADGKTLLTETSHSNEHAIRQKQADVLAFRPRVVVRPTAGARKKPRLCMDDVVNPKK